MNTGIYQILNIINGKRYIGSAVNFDRRWKEHRKLLRKNKHHSRHLQSAWNKYGEDSFKFLPVLTCTKELLLIIEQRAIDLFHPEYNINPTAGSCLGVKRTDEAKAKMSEAKRGIEFSPDHRAKLAEAKRGKKKTPAAIEKTAAAHRGMKHTPEAKGKMSIAHTGKTLSLETRARIGDANRGKKKPPRSPEHCAKISELAKQRYARINFVN